MNDSSPAMTVDELARRAQTSTRNVRNYQTLGLLAPPSLVGRVGYYSEGHLGRLRLIARLQQQGFTLAGIRRLVQAWEQGQSLGHLLGVEQGLTDPWLVEEPEYLTAKQLLELFPQAAQNVSLGQQAIDLVLIHPDGERFQIPSPTMLRVGAQLVAADIPLAAIHDEFAALHADMERIAARFVELFESYVWRPFVEEGMPPKRLSQVTKALGGMRALAAMLVQVMLATAMEYQSAASTAAKFELISEGAPQLDTDLDCLARELFPSVLESSQLASLCSGKLESEHTSP
jgi:DNA-binding transcriptional MerR regulator